MVKKRSELNVAAGKLVSAIQKEWGNELGTPVADISEKVMGSAHDLLNARTSEETKQLIGSLSVSQYLGEQWVKDHPSVLPAITRLEKILSFPPSK